MQPLFTYQPVLLGVLIASLIIWRVVEASVDIWTFKRLRAGARREDKGSHALLICLVTLGILLGALLAFKVPAAAITSTRTFLFWLGILLMNAGIAFRLYAIYVLGASFTTTVAVAPEQTLIETGPYRLIRHPSYYRPSHHAAWAWAQLYELVESVGPDGMCADWFELPYLCGRACPAGASRAAVSGVHAAYKTAHPLCTVTEDRVSPRSAHSFLLSLRAPGK